MEKRNVIYKGLDCLADTKNATYQMYNMQSKHAVPFAGQAVYARVTIYFGCAVVGLAILKHIWFSYSDWAYRRNPNRAPGYFGSFVAVLTSFSRSIGYKPINMHISKYLGLPATSASFLFIVASTAYLACYCFIPHFWYRGCRGFGSPPLATRSGVMATALIPFIYIMSGKANMITLLTGISYEKLNVFHQFAGVACFVLGAIHAIVFTYQDYAEGGNAHVHMKYMTFNYYSGIPPIIFLGFLCFGGSSVVRRYCYEAFLHVHWVCGMGFFGTMVWHIDNALVGDYMWAALAFWMAQLIYRALVKTCFRPNALFLKPRPGHLRKLDGNTFEVTVSNVADMHWGPGQHCFLRFVGSRVLDNHPFSISTVPVAGHDKQLKFIIIPKRGLTGVLYRQLDDAVTTNKKVFVDGPYGGSSRDPMSFDNLSLISSGTGVTATLPFLQYVSEAIAANREATVLRDVHFVWIARSIDNFEWIRAEVEHALQRAGDFITVDIYIGDNTDKAAYTPKDIDPKAIELERMIDSGAAAPDPSLPEGVNVYYTKPNVPQIMEDSKRFLKRRNMIVSSGSSSMRKQVSSCVSRLQGMVFNADLREHGPTVEEIFLHTEAFGWA